MPAREALRKIALRGVEATGNIRTETTIIFPNRVPDRGVVRAETFGTSEYVVRWSNPQGKFENVLPDANAVGYVRLESGIPAENRDVVSVGHRKTHAIHLAADLGFDEPINLGTYYDSGEFDMPMTPWSELSAAVREMLLRPRS